MSEHIEIRPDRYQFLRADLIRGREREAIDEAWKRAGADGAKEGRVTIVSDGVWVETWDRRLVWPEIEAKEVGIYEATPTP